MKGLRRKGLNNVARKQKHEKEPNHERWLVSYADFITLLFAVFVCLYAMSQTDKAKVESLVASIRDSFGHVKHGATSDRVNVLDSADMRKIPAIKPDIPTPGRGGEDIKISSKGRTRAEVKDFYAAKSAIENVLKSSGTQDKVNVQVTKRGLVVSLKEAGFFDSGSADMKKSSFALMDAVAKALAPFSNPIRVEGHTDNIPISSQAFKSNWELSTSRATNVVRTLTEQYGFQPQTISAVGYGEFRPIANNDSNEGRMKNRRVDIVILTRESEGGEA
jgi:chemotaxis protein MotB